MANSSAAAIGLSGAYVRVIAEGESAATFKQHESPRAIRIVNTEL